MKVYYLSTCSTCKQIIRNIPANTGIVLQDIKKQNITVEQLAELESLTGGIAALFSKKAKNYRLRKLHERELTSQEMRDCILEDYTFLKRPVAVIGSQIFIGSDPNVTDKWLTILKNA